jgi:hypothetical protein
VKIKVISNYKNIKIMAKVNEVYICNGKRFSSYEAVLDYCKENGYRVTNTNTIGRNKFLIAVASI